MSHDSFFDQKKFPAFAIRLENEADPAAPVNLNGIQIKLEATDPNHNLLSGIISLENQEIRLINGRCSVSDLRFQKVSSRFGGHYHLRCVVVTQEFVPVIQSTISGPITIKSKRLFRKVISNQQKKKQRSNSFS
eukprot:c6223_g1_i2.p1 GENE.c6223_g1_i2~~c6223_g1_i2.p1  ORF type:complete len:134 (+),score=40.21 c6223_g1_i2:326-727(+)